LHGEPYTAVGVMPPRTSFPQRDTQLWTPFALSPDQLNQRHAHDYLVYGRLKRGVRLGQAGAGMHLLARRMARGEEQRRGRGAGAAGRGRRLGGGRSSVRARPTWRGFGKGFTWLA